MGAHGCRAGRTGQGGQGECPNVVGSRPADAPSIKKYTKLARADSGTITQPSRATYAIGISTRYASMRIRAVCAYGIGSNDVARCSASSKVSDIAVIDCSMPQKV